MAAYRQLLLTNQSITLATCQLIRRVWGNASGQSAVTQFVSLDHSRLASCRTSRKGTTTMGRRRESAFEDLLTVASKLPWKVSLTLALVSFVVLHLVAEALNQPITSSNPAQLGPAIIRQYAHVFATLLQFIIPAGFLIGATVSFIKRSRSRSLLGSVRSGSGRDVSALSWQEFEALVGEGFRQRGFHVTERGGAAPDGGIDLILNKDREKFLVQCKQWRAQQVGVSIVRELYGVMAAEGAAGGYVVTSGKFTKDAVQFAQGRNIELIDGNKLEGLLREKSAAPAAAKVAPNQRTPMADAPRCPSCGAPMVERVAKQGPNAGTTFWGCGQYPKCRGTRNN
jgi:restriction system protein